MTKNESLQIGELIGEVKGINKRLDAFNGQIKDLTESVSKLPCQEQDTRIKFLEKVQNCEREDRRLKASIKGNIKAQVVGGVIGALSTGLVLSLTGLSGC